MRKQNIPCFTVHNPHLTAKKSEAGIYPVERSTLGEIEEKDSTEDSSSTQSSAVHSLLNYAYINLAFQ